MASLEERIGNLESQSDRQAAAIADVRTDIADLRLEMRTQIATLRAEMATRGDIAAVRADMATRGDLADLRADVGTSIADLRADLRELSRRWDRFFLWLAGTQVATLLAIMGVLAGILYR
ncbi:MAG: hypothetical protein HYY76_09175 [Acidobacteria bacterium]|nr:hypothetical protein [Acidobacteriota bacterium]